MIIFTYKDISDINQNMLLYGFCMMRYKGTTFDIVGIEELLEDFKSLRDKNKLEDRIKIFEDIIKTEKIITK